MDRKRTIWTGWGIGLVIVLVASVAAVILLQVNGSRAQQNQQPPKASGHADPGRQSVTVRNEPADPSAGTPSASGQQISATQAGAGDGKQGASAQGMSGEANRPAVGITFSPADDSTRVLTIAPGSPAQEAGIQPGDEVVAIDDQLMGTRSEVIQAVARKNPDAPVRIRFMRNGQEHNVSVQLKAREEVFGPPQQETAGAPQQSQPWLGISVRPRNQPALGQQSGDQQGQKNEQNRGLEIDKVFPAGPAAQAGVFAGDVILMADGRTLTSPQDLANSVRGKKVGEKVELSILRGSQTSNVPLVLGDRSHFLPSQGQVRQGAPMMNPSEQFAPPWALRLEQERSAAVQRQRIEDLVEHLTQEVRALRHDVEQLRMEPQRSSERIGQRPSAQGTTEGGSTR